MGMFIALAFIAPVLVGVLAQRWKRRTGAIWWFFSLLAEFAVFFVVGGAWQMHYPTTALTDGHIIAFCLTMTVFGSGATALIVATLPRRDNPPPVQPAMRSAPSAPPPQRTERKKRCPQCAEEVLQEARICRFCRYEFEAIATPEQGLTSPTGEIAGFKLGDAVRHGAFGRGVVQGLDYTTKELIVLFDKGQKNHNIAPEYLTKILV
jgi:hypothetical protein